MDMTDRFSRLLVMNTTLGTGDVRLSKGFLDWRAWVRKNPDMSPGVLLKRACPFLTKQECAAYDTPFPFRISPLTRLWKDLSLKLPFKAFPMACAGLRKASGPRTQACLRSPSSPRFRAAIPQVVQLPYFEWLCEEVLKAVPHRHFIFSIPKIFRRYFLYDRKLLSDLSRCGWDSLKIFFQETVPEEDAVPGAIIAMRSFGDFLGFNPHLHTLCTDGCFYGNGMFRLAPFFD